MVKADGLAAGKGVVIAKTKDEASAVANEMLSGRMLGEVGSRVVLEEFLEGDELSFLVVSDGERVAPLVAAQDHKRVFDGDNGPLGSVSWNTSGCAINTASTTTGDNDTTWHLSCGIPSQSSPETAIFVPSTASISSFPTWSVTAKNGPVCQVYTCSKQQP